MFSFYVLVFYTAPLYDLCTNHDLMSGFYADDSQLYVSCQVNEVESSFNTIELCVSGIQSWMIRNRLKLNGDKTELTVIAPPSISKSISPNPPPLNVTGGQVSPQSCCKNLGSCFDNHLSMSSHVKNVCKSSYLHMKNIFSIRLYLDLSTTETLIHAFISSRFGYCNCLLFGIKRCDISKLHKLQNCVARVCLNIKKKSQTPSLLLLKRLHWLPVSFRIDFKILLLVYKCFYGHAPRYLSACKSTPPPDRYVLGTSTYLSFQGLGPKHSANALFLLPV